MDSLVCMHCKLQSSATARTQTVRCYKCGAIIPVDSDRETNKKLAVEQKTDKKGFRDCFVRRRNSSSRGSTVSQISGSPGSKLSRNLSLPAPRGKKGLLVGVTYKKQKFKLRGTVHDVNSMKDLLVERFGFPVNSILILTEELGQKSPTKKNILESMRWLVADSGAGDSLVFYFSGHGLRQPDFDGDERDGFDETICPLDFQTEGMIIDNDINDTIVRPLKQGVTLHAIIDACHSGTMLDLPHVYCTKGNKWEDNSPPSGVYKGTSGGRAISFSACQDHQVAADTDAFSEKHMTGAMTYTFIKAVKENPNITYVGLLDSMLKAIEKAGQPNCYGSRFLKELFHRKWIQIPQLSSSEEFDVNSKFKL